MRKEGDALEGPVTGLRREVFYCLSSRHRRSSCPPGGPLYKMGRVQPLKLHAQVEKTDFGSVPSPSPSPLCQLSYPCTALSAAEATTGSLAQPSCLNPFCTHRLQSSLDSTSTQDGAETRVFISVLWKE